MRRAVLPILCLISLPTACTRDGEGGEPERAPPDAVQTANQAPSPCRIVEVTVLAGTIEAAAPGVRPHKVGALAQACTLPSPIAAFFTATEGGAEARATPEAVEAEAAAMQKLCAEPEVLAKALALAPPRERATMMYRGCDLARLGVMDEATWRRGQPRSLVPWYAYQWLREQGVADGHARVIATAMVVRDGRRWALPGQELPELAQTLGAVPDGVAVHVTQTEIRLDDAAVAQLDAAGAPGFVEPLQAAIAERVQQAEQGGGATYGRLVLVADARASFATIVDVLHAARGAGLHEYALVAEGAGLAGAIDIAVPAPAGDPEMGLSVHVDAAGFRVHGTKLPATAPGVEPDRIPLYAEPGTWDFVALSAAAVAHRDANPGAKRASVSADEDVAYGVVMQTLAALVGERCATTGECVLTELVVGARTDFMARNAGILGIMTGESGHFLASPYGAAFAVGDDDDDVWGGLTGTEIGIGGLGTIGTGEGGEGGGGGGGTIGLGEVGLIGKGGGGGTGSGFGSGKRVPTVKQAKATVKGSLDKDIIRRIVRAHINEVRYCYNQGLVDDPALAGKVSITFVIGTDGDVESSDVGDTTLADEDVESCIAKAVKRWKFPRPSGGIVSVTYPFVLSPG